MRKVAAWTISLFVYLIIDLAPQAQLTPCDHGWTLGTYDCSAWLACACSLTGTNCTASGRMATGTGVTYDTGCYFDKRSTTKVQQLTIVCGEYYDPTGCSTGCSLPCQWDPVPISYRIVNWCFFC
jgi:hypothetical protein